MGVVVPLGNHWLKHRLSRRRFVRTGSSGLLTVGAAACSRNTKGTSLRSTTGGQAGQVSQGTPVAGGTLRASYIQTTAIDPQTTSAAFHMTVAGVYSRIFTFKTSLDRDTVDQGLQNDLGLSAESPDGVIWTIKLRPDARFTNISPVNGHPVEAEDVKATFVRAVNPATSNPNLGQLSMIDAAQIQTPDKQTVVFKLNYPYAPFNRTLASPSYSLIIPREALTGSYDLAKMAIGSGPFVLESAVPDVAYTYKTNPGFFDTSMAPHIDGIHWAIIPDAAQRLAQFTAGNLDQLTLDSPFALDAALKSNPRATTIKAPNGIALSMYYQQADPTSIFRDIRVRRAFSMAIDRDTLGKAIFNGQWAASWVVPAYMGKWSLQIKDMSSDIQQWFRYDPAESKKLLDAAGAAGLELRTVYQNREATPAVVSQVQAVASMLSAAGIKINIVEVDYAKEWINGGKGINAGYYSKDTVPFSFISAYTEADEWLYGSLHSKSLQSHMTVKDPDLDAMIEKERATLDEGERLKAVQDILRYSAGMMYYTPTVGNASSLNVIQPRVQNFQFSVTPGIFAETYAKLWLSA